MNRIVCIGNKYLNEDALGSRVYDLLSQRDLPQDVELIDGGLAGLNLLSLFDRCERIVFVDAIDGDNAPGVITLQTNEIELLPVYGHGGGLGYLFRAHSAISSDQDPVVFVVGAGANDLAEDVSVAALKIAQGLDVTDILKEIRS